MGVPPKGRAERPAFRAAAILSPSILSSALRLLPFFFAAPKRGGLGTRAKKRNAVAAEAVSLHSVLRTDAAAQERSDLPVFA